MESAIATICFEETVPWAEMMLSTLLPKTRLPVVLFAVGCDPGDLGQSAKILLDHQKLHDSLRDRVNRGVNDLAKAAIFPMLRRDYGTKEVLYIDADCLILDKIDDVFEYQGGLLMAEEHHESYLGPLRKFYCVEQGRLTVPLLTFNAGVILFRSDCYNLWRAYYEKLCDAYPKEETWTEGQTVWNICWHKHPERAVLPRQYNQLHVRHGPKGAKIYHFAGMDSKYKTEVMRSCLQVFT